MAGEMIVSEWTELPVAFMKTTAETASSFAPSNATAQLALRVMALTVCAKCALAAFLAYQGFTGTITMLAGAPAVLRLRCQMTPY